MQMMVMCGTLNEKGEREYQIRPKYPVCHRIGDL